MMEQITKQIYSDLELLGLPTDFLLTLKNDYDSKNYGYYVIDDQEIVIPILDKYGNIMPYTKLLEIAIHECIHHYQWTKVPYFRRIKGVMHNNEFKLLNNHFLDLSRTLIYGGASIA